MASQEQIQDEILAKRLQQQGDFYVLNFRRLPLGAVNLSDFKK
jgi:hypothetical protein